MTLEGDIASQLAANEPPRPEGSTPIVKVVIESYVNGSNGDTRRLESPVAEKLPQTFEQKINGKTVTMTLLRSMEAINSLSGDRNLAIGKLGFAIDNGDRPTNEDRTGFSFRNVAIADGVGGYEHGEIAAEEALIETSLNLDIADLDEDQITRKLASIIIKNEIALKKRMLVRNPGSTTLMALTMRELQDDSEYYEAIGIAMGDSKGYVIEDDSIDRLTINHGMDGFVYIDAMRYAELLIGFPNIDLDKAPFSSAESRIGKRAVQPANYLDAIMKVHEARQRGKMDAPESLRSIFNDLLKKYCFDPYMKSKYAERYDEPAVQEIISGEWMNFVIETSNFVEYHVDMFTPEENNVDVSDPDFLNNTESMYHLFRLVNFNRLSLLDIAVGMNPLTDQTKQELDELLYEVENTEMGLELAKAITDKYTFRKKIKKGSRVIFVTDGGDDIPLNRIQKITNGKPAGEAARMIVREMHITGRSSTELDNDNLAVTVLDTPEDGLIIPGTERHRALSEAVLGNFGKLLAAIPSILDQKPD